MKKIILFWIIVTITIFSSLLLTNCSEEEDNFKRNTTMPVVITNEVNDITQVSATCGGVITSDGGLTVTERGVVWSNNESPTLLDNKTNDGKGAGSYSSNMTNLTDNKTYFVRAYATNDEGTSYGSTMSFKTLDKNSSNNNEPISDINYGTMTDTEGNIYKTVTIDGQTWMAENLKSTKYNDGTEIPNITDNYEWAELTTGAYCIYDNLESNTEIYGMLYNWHAVNTGKLAPDGWHVPTREDLLILKHYLIATGYAFDIVNPAYTNSIKYDILVQQIAKSLSATSDWKISSSISEFGNPGYYLNGNNSSGFSALPAGIRELDRDYESEISYATYKGLHEIGQWWLSDEGSVEYAYAFYLEYDSPYLEIDPVRIKNGCTVRLVKD